MLESAEATPTDGRVARSHRTRAAIVDALIGLLEEGNVQPTVEEVAARAGVAPRTVFQHYTDREALFAAVGARRQPRLDALMGAIDAQAPLARRVAELADQRARVYEWIAPVRRAALLMEPFSEAVHASLTGFRAVKRAEVRRVFAAELAALPAGERESVAAALCACTSYSAWETLRSHQGLDVEAAHAALLQSLRALLHVR